MCWLSEGDVWKLALFATGREKEVNWNPLPGPGVEVHPAMPQEIRERQAEPSGWPDYGIIHDADIDPDGPYECWCGEVGTYKELCDDSGLEATCGGLGSLNCFCGGDQCVCHHHGETDCPGCPECEELESEMEESA